MMKLKVLVAYALACAGAVCTAGDFDDVKPEPEGKKPAAAAKAKPGAKPAQKPDAKPAQKPGAKAPAAAQEAGKPAVKEAAETRPEPTEAERTKALKGKKPYYTKLAEGREVAWKCGLPLLVACVPSGMPASQVFEGKILKHKAFFKEFAPQNAVLVIWRLKPGKVEAEAQQGRGRGRGRGPRPLPKTIDTRMVRGADLEFLKQYGVSKEPLKYTDMANYPALICLDKSGRRALFRMMNDKDAASGAFGVWFAKVVNHFRAAGLEPKMTPYGEKICENPQEPKKWK